MVLFIGLPVEIWYLIINNIQFIVDRWCFKMTCRFFNELIIINPKYLKFNKSLVRSLVYSSRINQYLWILMRYNIKINYTNHTHSMNLYQDIYNNDKIKDYNAFVEFNFNEYTNFRVCLLLKNNNKFYHYLLHKGVLK